MRLSLDLFDFDLPAERVAQAPAEPRDASKLLLVPRKEGPFQHQQFTDLPESLHKGDLLVVNRTQVMPARLPIVRPSGAPGELLLCRPVDGPLTEATTWEGLGRPGSALKVGRTVTTQNGFELEVVARHEQTVRVRGARPLWDVLQAHGNIPLPPYIKRPEGPGADDASSYQSMFAAQPGAVAAPTASLHFTPRVLQALEDRGVQVADVLLHVGPGTFLPIRPEHSDDVRKHSMHSEWYEVPEATQKAVAETKARGGRVVAVGTTSLRALETWGSAGEARGESQLFVYPGFEFKVVSGLVTNFHLPRSTLLLLVSAFATRERILAAYREAIANAYRFYSYGDAMLLL